MTVIRDDFHVITPAGVVVYTFSTLAAAKSFVQARRHVIPGLYVDQVTIIEHRRRAYRPRPIFAVANEGKAA